MQQNILRLKFISLKDSNKKSVNNTLCFIKKLIELPSKSDESVIFQQTDQEKSKTISLNETFDWNINEGNYCQFIFLISKSKSQIKTDITLAFDFLLKHISDSTTEQQQTEILCNTSLSSGHYMEYSIQKVNGSLSLASSASDDEKHQRYEKVSSRQFIRGHMMKLTNFKQPVHCGICSKFIWGFHHQGFQCLQCSFVTHKKCCQNMPFWCQKSAIQESNLINGNFRLKFNVPHTFKQYEAPIVRAIVTKHHGHCNHCGSQIVRHGLKCTQCHFIIHSHCQANVPPMCTIAYNSFGKIIPEDVIKISTRFHGQNVDIQNDNESKLSSFDLSWLGPLPESEIPIGSDMSLPKFEDFHFIGRLGDGACAQVFCVQHKQSQEHFAIKVVDGTKEQIRQQFEVERQILFRYSQNNPYMIDAYCTFHRGNKLFLVMELVEDGTLYHKIQTTRMNEDEIKFYLAEIICVLQYLHSNNIVYRDLKLEHAAICSGGHIRLVDYGLGRILKKSDELCHTFCGTYSYMAPEVRDLEHCSTKNGYSYPVDFWALGIMFLQMLCGEQLDFHPQLVFENTEETLEPKNFAEKLELSRRISPEAHSCLIGLLENDPNKRLGSPDSPHGLIRDHAFFKVGRKIDWQDIDEGLFKSFQKFNGSSRRPVSVMIMDRGEQSKADWIAAGESASTSISNEKFKQFDYINKSAWFGRTQLQL